MTLIIKELVIKSTIVDKKVEQGNKLTNERQLKEEIIKACTNKLIRHFKKQNER